MRAIRFRANEHGTIDLLRPCRTDQYQNHKLHLWRHSNSTQWLLFLLKARSSCKDISFAQGNRTTSSPAIWPRQEEGYSLTEGTISFCWPDSFCCLPSWMFHLFREDNNVRSFFIWLSPFLCCYYVLLLFFNLPIKQTRKDPNKDVFKNREQSH